MGCIIYAFGLEAKSQALRMFVERARNSSNRDNRRSLYSSTEGGAAARSVLTVDLRSTADKKTVRRCQALQALFSLTAKTVPMFRSEAIVMRKPGVRVGRERTDGEVLAACSRGW